MATAAKDRAVSLSRIVALSVVPRAGETLWVDPYTEELRIESVTWHIDPDAAEDPDVTLQLSDIDFEVPPLARRPTIMAVGREGSLRWQHRRSTPTSCVSALSASTLSPTHAR